MRAPRLYYVLKFCFAAVWLVNGLYAKLLGQVPRHELIVERLLGEQHALLTKLIGIGEIAIAIWILSGIRPKACAMLQIALVLVMNAIEFVFCSDLLLFGRFNSVIAILFVIVIYFNEFKIRPNTVAPLHAPLP